MKLLIDAGNTRIKWALSDGMTRCARATCAGEYERASNGVLQTMQADGLPQQFSGIPELREIWVSNVAGEDVARHIRNIGAGQHPHTCFIVARKSQCGVRNSYTDPAQLGSDRWAALIAAWHLAGRSCLVVNCGTATTIDALSATGEFTGGLILPGVELMRRSLGGATAQLKPGQGTYAAFPRNTADAMFSGAIQASCGAIQRQHALLGDDNAPVILNGGAVEILHGHLLNLPLRMEDNLVLQGLLLIAREASA